MLYWQVSLWRFMRYKQRELVRRFALSNFFETGLDRNVYFGYNGFTIELVYCVTYLTHWQIHNRLRKKSVGGFLYLLLCSFSYITKNPKQKGGENDN